MTQQDPTSFFLNDGIDAARFNEREVSAAQWLYDNGLNRSTSRPGGVPAYADAYRSLLLSSIRYSDVPWDLRNWSSSTLQDAYAYYGTFNLATGESAQQGASKTFLNGTVISHVPIVAAPGCAKLYDDGGAVVYYRDPMRHTFPSSKR